MKIKILQVVHEMNQGGIENFLMNVYRNIDREKVQFDFIVHINQKGVFDDEIKALGGAIYHCPDYKIYNHLQYKKWWNDFFLSHPEYKIIHSHLDSSANIHLRIAKKYGLKTIAHSHSTSEGFGFKSVVKHILKFNFNSCCDFKMACSTAAAKWLFSNQCDEVVVIKNGIDVKRYTNSKERTAEMKDKLSLTKYDLVIGHVGRLDDNKNQSFILDILKDIRLKGINACAVFVGKDYNKEKLIEKSKSLDVFDCVKYLGIRNDVPDILQAFDIFVFPSLYEGLGIALIEAQASNLPCIVSSTVTREVKLCDNVEFLSLKSSSVVWANKVIEMIKTPRVSQTTKIIESGYDISTSAKWLENFYIDLSKR